MELKSEAEIVGEGRKRRRVWREEEKSVGKRRGYALKGKLHYWFSVGVYEFWGGGESGGS